MRSSSLSSPSRSSGSLQSNALSLSPAANFRSAAFAACSIKKTLALIGGRSSVRVRSDGVMQLGVVRPEMAREPGVQTVRQLNRVDLLGLLERVHDLAQLVEQALVVLLVRRQPLIALIAHELLLEREVRRDSGKQIAEERRYRLLGIGGHELLVEPIDQVDELPVLVVDRCDADAVFVFPTQQRHGALPCPYRSGCAEQSVE